MTENNQSETMEIVPALERTPLHGLHLELGAKMVPFAGYDMPVNYGPGVLKEHLHTRHHAGLFDVSHMGQAILGGDAAARDFERLVPGDITALATGRMRYTQFTNEQGGIKDDLMVTRLENGDKGLQRLFLVVNAACKEQDFAHIRAELAKETELALLENRALLALQGPEAVTVLARFVSGCTDMPFMSMRQSDSAYGDLFVSRCGYTGEDGFEISVEADQAEALARALLAEAEVEPVGLGARDTLRMEAGLCLYGHDIDETTTPVEAGLTWSISKRRREEGGFPGDAIIKAQLRDGPPRKLVGIQPEGRAPARDGVEIRDSNDRPVGTITSGGYSPSLERPIAMGYVEAGMAAAGSAVQLVMRGGKRHPASVQKMPFVAHNYYRPARG